MSAACIRAARVLALAAALLANATIATTPAIAQDTAAARSTRLTLGDIVGAVELARRVADFPRVDPATDAILARNVDRLARSRVLTRPLDEVAGDAARPDLLGRARWRQRSYDFDLPDSLGAVLDTILLVVNGELRDALGARGAGEAEVARIRAPFDSLQDAQLRRSLDESAERLRRFEVMYGPGSAKLNWVEALLNYGAQWLPGFGVDARAGPRPFELVAAYTSTYLTMSDERARAVSAGETGLRMYIFARGWGGEGRMGVLKPRHVAAGWAFTGPDDVALQAPWRERGRSGPFVAWGDIKVAYITGREKRLLVTRQLQMIPLVF